MERLYRARSWIATAPTILVAAAALVLTARPLPKPAKEPETPPVKIQLTALPEPPQPEPPQPEPPPPAPPRPAPVARPKPVARPTPQPAPAPVPQETAAEATPAATATPSASAPTAPAPAPPSNASVEDAYAAQIRADIEANKHYPTSKEARLARPHGEVEVWFRLDRSGAVKEAGIQTSSSSLILDQAALALVRSGSYPPFPANAFPGAGEHRFVVTLSYAYS